MFDQIAIVTENELQTKLALQALGAKNWISDVVESEGVVRGKPVKNVLKLFFNYEICLQEFEILQILEGESFQNELVKPGISHFGLHVESADNMCGELQKEGYEYIGYMNTKKHSSSKNLYHYVFMENKHLGIFVKLIERLPAENKSTYSSSIHYLDILNKAKIMRNAKVSDYGEKRYQLSSAEFDNMMCFSDVYRKFIRIENHYKNGKKMNFESLKDSYYDLLNYVVMSIQIMELHEQREKE